MDMARMIKAIVELTESQTREFLSNFTSTANTRRQQQALAEARSSKLHVQA